MVGISQRVPTREMMLKVAERSLGKAGYPWMAKHLKFVTKDREIYEKPQQQWHRFIGEGPMCKMVISAWRTCEHCKAMTVQMLPFTVEGYPTYLNQQQKHQLYDVLSNLGPFSHFPQIQELKEEMLTARPISIEYAYDKLSKVDWRLAMVVLMPFAGEAIETWRQMPIEDVGFVDLPNGIDTMFDIDGAEIMPAIQLIAGERTVALVKEGDELLEAELVEKNGQKWLYLYDQNGVRYKLPIQDEGNCKVQVKTGWQTKHIVP